MNRILKKFLPLKKSFLGLDIGQSTIKAVEIKKVKDKYEIIKAGQIETPNGAIDDGRIVNSEALSSALNKLMSTYEFSNREVFLIVNGSSVITRQVPMPVMDNKDITSALKYEAERYIPIPVEDLIIDHIIIGQEDGEEGPQYNLLLIAVPQQIIYQYYDLLIGVGLTPAAIEIVPTALWRLHNYINIESETTDSAFVVVDIGTKISNLVVFVKDQLVYNRTIPVGGSQVTESIAQTFMLGFEDAEEYKKRDGQIIVEESFSLNEEDVNSNSIQLDLAIRSGLSELIHEIQRSLDHFKLNFKSDGSQDSDKLIKTVYVLGGTSKITGLVELFEAELGIPVEEVQTTRFSNDYALALGLALREVIN